jgi:hypothetical protein
MNEAETLTLYVPRRWLKWAQTYLDLWKGGACMLSRASLSGSKAETEGL